MVTRRFEFSAGVIGTQCQQQTGEFGSEAEAHKPYTKLVTEKLKKGYSDMPTDGETPSSNAGAANKSTSAASAQPAPTVSQTDATSPAEPKKASPQTGPSAPSSGADSSVADSRQLASAPFGTNRPRRL